MWHEKCFKLTTIFFLFLRPRMKNSAFVSGSLAFGIHVVSLGPTS